MTTYLDCNATTPVDPRVLTTVLNYLSEEFGNAGSRTHEYGARAKKAVEHARRQVAAVVDAQPDEVVFTSGATESNNLAILGLAKHGESSGRRHVITTAVEHKAVLEPCERLKAGGFDLTVLPVSPGGWVEPDAVAEALRSDTLLVSVMHVNNETGVIQPIEQIARALSGHPAFFHVDAAQGFGKDIGPLRLRRIDLISASGHKLYSPKGVGALITRRRGFSRPPLQPLVFGGGQERGLRPGTLPVALLAGFGHACELAVAEHGKWSACWSELRATITAKFSSLDVEFIGDQQRCLANTVSLRVPGVDSEAAMVALKDVVTVSNGSACTSAQYTPSHVLTAMGLATAQVQGAIRMSWCHLTEPPDVDTMVARLAQIRHG